MKIKEFIGDKLLFYCPGCKHEHYIDKSWDFNGDYNNPTISPSILAYRIIRCHSFIRNGKIEFLSDCEHELAGQIVELLEIE